MRSRLLVFLLASLLSAGVPASPSGPASAPGSNAAPPPGTHEPELVEDEPAPWKWIAAAGAVLLLAGIGIQMSRSRSRREKDDVREARDSFLNPVRVIRFHRDAAPKATDEGGLQAVTKTVDAVMEAEQKAKGADAELMAQLAAGVAGKIAAQASAEEPEAGPSPQEEALREMLASQLSLARDWQARGRAREARELASMIAKDKQAPAGIREEAAAFVKALPAQQDPRHADRARG